MFKIIKKLVVGSLLYGIIIYAIATYVPELGLAITNTGQYTILPMLLLLGIIFFLVNRIIKKTILLFKLPLNILTLGLGSFIINVLMLYVFVMSVNSMTLSTGISIQVGSIVQIIILAVVLSIADRLVQGIQ